MEGLSSVRVFGVALSASLTPFPFSFPALAAAARAPLVPAWAFGGGLAGAAGAAREKAYDAPR